MTTIGQASSTNLKERLSKRDEFSNRDEISLYRSNPSTQKQD